MTLLRNGPNDYCKIRTTLARQIANWVIIYSPLQMAADLIGNYEGHEAFRFFRDFNADRKLKGTRRSKVESSSGRDWEIRRGGKACRRKLLSWSRRRQQTALPRPPLDFLKENVRNTAVVYADHPSDPTKVVISGKEVTSSDTLQSRWRHPAVRPLLSLPKTDPLPIPYERMQRLTPIFANENQISSNYFINFCITILRLFFENLLTAPRSQVFNPLKI